MAGEISVEKTEAELRIRAAGGWIRYQMGMMNRLPWLVPFRWVQTATDEMTLIYEKGTTKKPEPVPGQGAEPVTGQESKQEPRQETGKEQCLTEWLAREPSISELADLTEALGRIYGDLDRFFLDEAALWFDPDWIFWNPEEKMLRCVYVPTEYRLTDEILLNSLPDYLWRRAAEGRWAGPELPGILLNLKICSLYGEWPCPSLQLPMMVPDTVSPGREKRTFFGLSSLWRKIIS